MSYLVSGEEIMTARYFCTVAFAALLACCNSAFAGPTFESVTFGNQSTHCDAKNASRVIVLDGRGVSVFFDKMLIEVGSKASGTERNDEWSHCGLSTGRLKRIFKSDHPNWGRDHDGDVNCGREKTGVVAAIATQLRQSGIFQRCQKNQGGRACVS
jgi:hypothetical protein